MALEESRRLARANRSRNRWWRYRWVGYAGLAIFAGSLAALGLFGREWPARYFDADLLLMVVALVVGSFYVSLAEPGP